MMSIWPTDSSTTRPVAVVAPCRHSEFVAAESLTVSEQTSRCNGATSTEHRGDEAQAAALHHEHKKLSDDRQPCSESTETAARSSNIAVDRQTSTCTVKPSRRVVEPDDDDDDLTTCRFYHGNITSEQAKRRLAGKNDGTYLLRDSQSPGFPFALSVRTSGRSGVTSLRIARDGNRFRLDCDEAHRESMPTFDSVLRLVRHFVAECDGGGGGRCVLVGSSGRHEQNLTLRQPLHRPAAVSSNDNH